MHSKARTKFGLRTRTVFENDNPQRSAMFPSLCRSLRLLTLFPLLFCRFAAFAQTVSGDKAVRVRGVVVDSVTNEPLAGALVSIAGTAEGGTLTDEKGEFLLYGLKKNETNLIETSYMGYRTDTTAFKPLRNQNALVRYIRLHPTAFDIGEATVQGAAVMTLQKGDTTQFNAAAFKVNPDATVAELLKKMPGFRSQDGKTEVHGKTVERVYVDGKSYFKNAPEEALKSLPADAVESIQVYDEKTDDAKFTGYDDGTRVKTLNIVTKAKKKQSYMGEYTVAGGPDDRYLARANTNLFRENHRYTLLAGANNLSQSSTGGGFYFGGGAGEGSAAGVRANYSGEFGQREKRKAEINASYSYDNTRNENTYWNRQLYFATDRFDSRENESESTNRSNNNSHRFDMDVTGQPNERHRITFRPSVSFDNSGANAYHFLSNLLNGAMSNTTRSHGNTQSDNYRIGSDIGWQHNVNEKQNLSAGISFDFSDRNSSNTVTGRNLFYRQEELVDSLLNQNTLGTGTDNSVSARFGYNFILNKKSRINLFYNGNYNWNRSDRRTLLFDPATGSYAELVPELSNRLDNEYLANNAGIGYSFNMKDKTDLHINAGYTNASQRNRQFTPEKERYSYNFHSVNYHASVNIRFTPYKYFSISAGGNSSAPPAFYLQDVVNNDNPLQVRKGNPSLRQSFSHNVGLYYTASHIERSTHFSAYVNYSASVNDVAQNTVFAARDTVVNGVSVQKGARITSPVNVNGRFSLTAGGSYGMPLKALKCNLNLSASYGFSRNPAVQDNLFYYSRNHTGHADIGLFSNISEKIDFSVNAGGHFSYADASNGYTPGNAYLNLYASARINWIFFRGFFVRTDYNYAYQHYSTGQPENPDYHMLNLSVGKKFRKKQNVEIRLSGYDLLNQTQSYSHDVTPAYVQDSRRTVVKRIFLLSCSYKFNTMGQSGNP